MRTVNLVATIPAINQWFPNHNHIFQTEICSADFPIDPAMCKTKFGRWLAERISTTRFDDDFSALTIVNGRTDAERVVTTLVEELKQRPIRSQADMALFIQMLRTWSEKQEKFDAVYGDSLYKHSSTKFKWPVFGSAAAAGAETPENYFDKCAGLIRNLKPKRVYIDHSGENVPVSFCVTR